LLFHALLPLISFMDGDGNESDEQYSCHHMMIESNDMCSRADILSRLE